MCQKRHEGVEFEARDGTESCTVEGVHSWDPSNPCSQGKADAKTMMMMYEQSMPNIFEVCDKADETLFRSVMNNSEHVLHQYLPPRQTHNYALRARPHDR